MSQYHPSDNPDAANKPFSLKRDLHTIATLLPYLWPAGEYGLRVRVLIALVFLILSKVTNVWVPILYKQALDALGGNETGAATGGMEGDVVAVAGVMAVPFMLLIAYGVVRVLSQAFGELRDAIFTKVAQRAIRKAGIKTFRHLHALSLSFHVGRKTGHISRAVERGTKGIEFLLRFSLFSLVPTLFEIILVCIILMYMYEAIYALVTFVTIAGYIVWTLVVTEKRITWRRVMNESDSEAHTKAIDSLLNFETVKYFNNEAHEARRFDIALARYEKAATVSGVSLSLLNVGQGFIISFGLTVIMIMAAMDVVSGSMTLGDFVLVNVYLLQLYLPLNFLGFVYREIKQSLTDMEQMFSLLYKVPDVQDVADAPPLEVHGGTVTYDKVMFHYDTGRQILKSVSFHVPAGKTLAIVGSSGSGKSTIARLLYRFYDISAGHISIDGQNIAHVTQASLHEAIGMVPQDTVLFNDTIRYNIAYGRPSASAEEIENAARLARIYDFIMELPDGFDSMVGERGLKLSGGEKQRVAIARTILKNPSLLIFDEATSALDSHTEKEIQASLNTLSKNRTTIIIAHRLSTITHADAIIVLEKGEIKETGTHRQLLREKGLYASMWLRQQEVEKALHVLAAAEGEKQEKDTRNGQ